MTCPISEIIGSLHHTGKPPLAWVVKWGRCDECEGKPTVCPLCHVAGRDPMRRAWARAESVPAMAKILRYVGRDDDAAEIYSRAFYTGMQAGDSMRVARNLIPPSAAPTLAEVLAVRERGATT